MTERKKKIKTLYGFSINYWRRLYEQEFGRNTSLESDDEFVRNHISWIKENRDSSRHSW